MSTVATASRLCLAPHVTRRKPWVPGAAVAHIATAGASPQPFVRSGRRRSVRGAATATTSHRNQSAPASARCGLGVNHDRTGHRATRSSRGARPRWRGSRDVQVVRACRCAASESTRPVRPAGVSRRSRPTKKVCAVCFLRHATGSVRPTTATAWRKDSAWHSPTSGSGPGVRAARSPTVSPWRSGSRPVPRRSAPGPRCSPPGRAPPPARRGCARPWSITRAASIRRQLVRRLALRVTHLAQHLQHGRRLAPGQRTDDRLHRAHRAGRCRSGRGRRGRTASSRPRRRPRTRRRTATRRPRGTGSRRSA